jgi:hypothetical protein
MHRGAGYGVAKSGVVFGLAAAAVEVLNGGFVVALSKLTGSTNPYAQPPEASSLLFFLGGIVLATLLFGAVYLAGAVAARHTSRVRSGLFAGLLAGTFDGVSAGVIAAVLTFMAPTILVALYDSTVPPTGQEAFTFRSLAELRAGRAAVGAGVGLWGDYRGRAQHHRRKDV